MIIISQIVLYFLSSKSHHQERENKNHGKV